MLFQITGKAIIKVICLIGCLFQVSSVTKRFLSFDVRKEMSSIVPIKNEIPDIHIAIQLKYLIDLNKFHEKNPSFLKALCDTIVKRLGIRLSDEETWQRNCSKKLFDSSFITTYMYTVLTVKQIENLLIDPATLIRSIYLADDDDENALETGLCTVGTRFSASRAFLIISCSNNSQPLYIESFKLWIDKGYMMLITHLFKFPYDIRLKSHGSEVEGYPQLYTSIKALTNGSLSVAKLRFNRKVTKLLPWPFKSDCDDNGSTYSAFINCLNKQLDNSKDRSKHQHTVISFGSVAGQTKFISVLNESSKYDKCFQLATKSPCDQVDYILEVQNLILGNTEYGYGIITISKLSLFDILYTSTPEFPFADFTIFLVSIISIWYGFNIYDCLKSHEIKAKIYQVTSIQTISRKVDERQNDPSFQNFSQRRSKFYNNEFYTYLSRSKLYKAKRTELPS